MPRKKKYPDELLDRGALGVYAAVAVPRKTNP
jgi:hypothetical protein